VAQGDPTPLQRATEALTRTRDELAALQQQHEALKRKYLGVGEKVRASRRAGKRAAGRGGAKRGGRGGTGRSGAGVSDATRCRVQSNNCTAQLERVLEAEDSAIARVMGGLTDRKSQLKQQLLAEREVRAAELVRVSARRGARRGGSASL
jgi:hypothetical protein